MSYASHIDRISKLVDPHWMSREKAEAIGQLCDKLRPVRTLEIGTWQGTGTCYLAAFASDYDGHVVTVDKPWTAKVNDKIKTLAEDQLRVCGLTNASICRLEGGAEEWFRGYFYDHLRKPLDLVYLDNGHQWHNTAAQLIMSWAALRNGGWIVLDDIVDGNYPDVGLVWRELVPSLAPSSDHYQLKVSKFSTLGFLLKR